MGIDMLHVGRDSLIAVEFFAVVPPGGSEEDRLRCGWKYGVEDGHVT
jgi:hypothetical protein